MLWSALKQITAQLRKSRMCWFEKVILQMSELTSASAHESEFSSLHHIRIQLRTMQMQILHQMGFYSRSTKPVFAPAIRLWTDFFGRAFVCLRSPFPSVNHQLHQWRSVRPLKDIRHLQVLEEAAERVRGCKTDAGTSANYVLWSPKENEELQMMKYTPHTRPSFRFGSVLGIGSSRS